MQSMVKCLICGAVFSAEETVCPVCGAGPEQFVPVAPENVSFRRDTQEIFLVLGGGTAAFSAAEAIRERNATCSIVLVTDEDTPPYARPMLTKSFGAAEETLYLREPAWFERQRILLLTGRRVERLDPNAQEVWLDGGARLHYDRCVYALGAECFIPPIPGASMPGAVAIRRLRDIRAIRRRLDGGAQRAVVIGGGVLGLEAAWALRQQGCRVTVLEASERAMMRQLDEESSAMLMDIARQAGVEILCRAQSERILGTEHVEGVRLQSGEELPADLVVLSCGVRANLAVAQAAGAKTERAVVVDAHMRTTLPGVFACGDCAQYEGMNSTIWPVATEMGRIAGANAAGEALPYRPVSLAITFQGMGTSLYADGDTGRIADRTYRVETRRDDARKTLEKRFYWNDTLCGVILLGDISQAGDYARQL